MPNIVAHVLVAAETCPTPTDDVLLGSALPDFLGIYRDHRGGSLRAADFRHLPATDMGIQIHKQTDSIYDSLGEIRNIKVETRQLLEAEAGIARGPARACADVGVDLLVDSMLLENKSHRDKFGVIERGIFDGSAELLKIGDFELEDLIHGFFKENVVTKYKHTERIATMMYFRFMARRRQKLAFDEDAIPDVADILYAQKPAIRDVANIALQKTVAGVKQLCVSV